jgi:hypothetical protein
LGSLLHPAFRIRNPYWKEIRIWDAFRNPYSVSVFRIGGYSVLRIHSVFRIPDLYSVFSGSWEHIFLIWSPEFEVHSGIRIRNPDPEHFIWGEFRIPHPYSASVFRIRIPHPYSASVLGCIPESASGYHLHDTRKPSGLQYYR